MLITKFQTEEAVHTMLEMVANDNLLKFNRPYYKSKDIMHNLSHIERVRISLQKLLKSGNYHVDTKVLMYALYFHGFIYNSENKIKSWLKNQNISDEMINKIVTAAWESQKDRDAQTLEGRLLHDAHMIEGGKAYLIVKPLITGSLRGQALNETIKYIEDNILDKGICYLPEAQSIYKKQQKFAKNFIHELKDGISL